MSGCQGQAENSQAHQPSSAQQSDSCPHTESFCLLQWMTALCPPNMDGWLVAVKNRAVRWRGGLSAWQCLCFGGWQNCTHLTSIIAYFILFSFSITLHLDCFFLHQFLLQNWVEVSPELMAPCSCHCMHRWHWDTIATRDVGVITQNMRHSLALSPLSQSEQWRSGITASLSTILPAAGSFL